MRTHTAQTGGAHTLPANLLGALVRDTLPWKVLGVLVLVWLLRTGRYMARLETFAQPRKETPHEPQYTLTCPRALAWHREPTAATTLPQPQRHLQPQLLTAIATSTASTATNAMASWQLPPLATSAPFTVERLSGAGEADVIADLHTRSVSRR